MSAVKSFPKLLGRYHETCYKSVPSKSDAIDFLNNMVALLFPVTHGQPLTPEDVEYRWLDLQLQLRKLITPVMPACDCHRSDYVEEFFGRVPEIYESLLTDAELFNACDPAAFCKEEVILSYPGFYAIAVYRFAHVLSEMGIPILPRILSEHAHSKTGIDIHPGAVIGEHFYIDHGTGVVIGETCTIGDNVKMYQGVTLGAKFVRKELQGTRRHPQIGDNVILYAGCTILGGDTVIGHDSVIGGNVWLTESVPPHTTVFHKPDIVIRNACGLDERRETKD
ncbi:MAG: serine O-acetyltransferase [Rikenellaceae bacterium]|jgi:serine O-acetyltransferase|nr:serine O-acetyltransferase [Rikenellaceae bacterium]